MNSVAAGLPDPTLAGTVDAVGDVDAVRESGGDVPGFYAGGVSEGYAQQHTEAAGTAYVAVQTAEVERLERETPVPPAGPAKQCLSADGAMVPLVGGEWAEVKTLVIGEVAAPVLDAKRGEEVVHL